MGEYTEVSQKQQKNKNKFKSKNRHAQKSSKNKRAHTLSSVKSSHKPLPESQHKPSLRPSVNLEFTFQPKLKVKKVVKNSPSKTWLPFGTGGPCPQLGECGACPLLPLSPQDQYQWKLKNLKEYFAQYNCLESVKIYLEPKLSKDPTLTSHYRYSAKPSVRPGLSEQDPFKIGLYQPKSHELIDLKDCLVQSPLINELLQSLRRYCPQVGLRAYQHSSTYLAIPPQPEVTQDEVCRLRYVVIRQGESLTESSQKTLYLTLILQNPDWNKLNNLIRLICEQHKELSGISIHENNLLGNAIFDFSKPSTLIWGEPALYHRLRLQDQLSPLLIQVSASSFTQVNPLVAERAYRKVVELLEPQAQDLVLDLYCGVGSIGLLLATQARLNGGPLKKLWGVEETQSSIDDALINAHKNGIAEAEFILGRAEDQLDLLYKKLQEESDSERKPIIALNPSRRGCHPNVLQAIARLKPRKIVYMSCHARTLSRDLSILFGLGYQAEDCILFDMFPGSFHYETVTSLIPKPYDS